MSDPFFLPPGAEAFKRDNPTAEIHFFDTGHFALETQYPDIAIAVRDFLGRKLAPIDKLTEPMPIRERAPEPVAWHQYRYG
ncbi:MAG TPA: hypothetical protein VH088_11130 [Terriglobales bacterium]|nr:hypothetical protein [Terriglobales bacterium]